MKLFIIVLFLGCLIFNVHAHLDSLIKGEASFQTGLFQKASETSDSFVKAITNPLNQAYNQTKDIFKKTKLRLIDTREKALRSFSAIITKIKIKIYYMKKDPRNGKCAAKNEILLNEIKKEVEERLKKCATDFKYKVNEQNEPIDDELEEINDRIDAFRLMTITCVQLNPVATTECVFNKINEYNGIIDNVAENFHETLTSAAKNTNTFPNKLVDCNTMVVQKGFIRLQELKRNMAKCLRR